MLRLKPLPRDPSRLDGLALVHPGRADAWWHLGGHRFAWHDGDRLFVERGDEVLCLLAEGPVHVVPTDGGCLALTPSREFRIGSSVEEVDPRAARLGRPDAHRRGGEWVADGLDLPLGARRARSLRPFPTGRGAVWTADGWTYRMEDRPHALGPAGTFLVGPGGAVVVGDDDVFRHAAALGRPLAPLPCPLAAPVRFAPDGTRVDGVDPDGEGVAIDLRSLRVVERRDAVPVGGGWLLPDGRLLCDGALVRSGIREASWAVRDHLLAGPGGRIRDLRTGEVVGDAEVHLGATVATATGFCTVHWETGEGLCIDARGRAVAAFRIPLEEDDVVVDGRPDGEGARFGTALGRGWRVDGAVVDPAEPPEVERPEPPEGWEIPVEAETVVSGVRWGWTTDGLLLARPADG